MLTRRPLFFVSAFPPFIPFFDPGWTFPIPNFFFFFFPQLDVSELSGQLILQQPGSLILRLPLFMDYFSLSVIQYLKVSSAAEHLAILGTSVLALVPSFFRPELFFFFRKLIVLLLDSVTLRMSGHVR